MFVRYPYRRDNYYRSRVAPMEIDRDESPIWAMPVAKKKLGRNSDEEMRNRHTTSRKGLFRMKKERSREEEKEEDKKSSQTKLVKFDPEKNNSKRNKYEETEEQMTEYVDNNYESESDYEEDSIETENQMSFEYQHPGKLIKPMPYNNPYYSENMMKQKTSVLKDSSFPQLLSSYSKFLFNVLLLVVALWIMFNFITTVKTDMKIKYNEYVMDNMNKITKCYEDYKINKCSSDERIPFLENTCREWEACMSQNPDEIRMIMIGAEVVSEILNKFIEPLSTKTTVVIIIVSIVFFFIIWKMGGDPSKVKKDKKGQTQFDQEQFDQMNQMNQEGMPLGMCPPPSMDPGFISNGGVMYPIAPAAIYPGNPPYPIPVTYPQVYPYPVYPPAYHDDRDIHYSSRPNPKYRKSSRHSPSPPPPQKKNYRFVKSSRSRNPYQSRFRVNEPRYHSRHRGSDRYYYEDDDRDDRYDMVEDDDSYFDEDYGY